MRNKDLYRQLWLETEPPPGGGEGSAEGNRLLRVAKTMAVTVPRMFYKGLNRREHRQWTGATGGRKLESEAWKSAFP